METLTVVSLLASGAALVLAIVTIFFTRAAEREMRVNFDQAQKLMAQQYDRTKSLLAEIDKRAAVTERTVTDSQEKLLNMVTSIIKETVLPKKEDMGEAFGMAFIQLLMQDPAKAGQVIEKMAPLLEAGGKIKEPEEQGD